MDSRMSLLSIIVVLCLGDVLGRGVEREQKKTFSAQLEVIHPQIDCIRRLRANTSTSGCDVNLFGTKAVDIENIDNMQYLMWVEIGNPKQKFKVKIDTGSDVLWVFGEECKDSDPLCKGHRKFESGKSTTFTDEKRELNLKYLIGEVLGKIGRDDVFITDGLKATKQLFGAASKVDQKRTGSDGLLGINMLKTIGEDCAILNALKAAGMAPIISLFLKEGSKPDGGEITFGGVNEARFEKGLGIRAPVVGDGHFIVEMTNVKFGDTTICTLGGEVYCRANVDSGAPVIVGPKKEIDEFNTKVLKAKDTGMYPIVDCGDFEEYPDITINLRGKLLRLDAYDYIEVGEEDCYSLLYGVDHPSKRWVLGLPVLRHYYTEFNMNPGSPSVTFHKRL